MTEQQHERAVDLTNAISAELRALVDVRLQGVDAEVEDLVRTMLTEQMRFWKGY